MHSRNLQKSRALPLEVCPSLSSRAYRRLSGPRSVCAQYSASTNPNNWGTARGHLRHDGRADQETAPNKSLAKRSEDTPFRFVPPNLTLNRYRRNRHFSDFRCAMHLHALPRFRRARTPHNELISVIALSNEPKVRYFVRDFRQDRWWRKAG